jgi:hypothetical protein
MPQVPLLLASRSLIACTRAAASMNTALMPSTQPLQSWVRWAARLCGLGHRSWQGLASHTGLTLGVSKSVTIVYLRRASPSCIWKLTAHCPASLPHGCRPDRAALGTRQRRRLLATMQRGMVAYAKTAHQPSHPSDQPHMLCNQGMHPHINTASTRTSSIPGHCASAPGRITAARVATEH